MTDIGFCGEADDKLFEVCGNDRYNHHNHILQALWGYFFDRRCGKCC